MTQRKHSWLLFAALSCLLAACGGGGSAVATGGIPIGGGSSPALTVSSDRSSLLFVGFTRLEQRTETVQFAIKGGSGTYYGVIELDVPNAFRATFTPTSDTTAEVVLVPYEPKAGRRLGNITFKLCPDPACNKVAWSQVMPYTQEIFALDATSVSVRGFEGAALAPQRLAITPADGTQALSIVSSVDNGSGWLSANRNGGQLDVNLSAVGMKSGSYRGTVSVSLTGRPTAGTLKIPVAFTVGTGTLVSAVPTIDLTADTTSASLSRSTALSFADSQARAWTASSDQPWLILSTSAGKGAGNLAFTIDPNRMPEVANWGLSTAQIQVKAEGMADAQVDISVNKRLPEVHWVNSRTVVSGQASSVRVFGRGFSQLPGVDRLLVAGVPAKGKIVSDTEAALDLPPLPVGRVAVSIKNALNIPTRNAAAGAVLPRSIPASSVDSLGDKRSVLFDPARQAVFAVDWTNSELVRHRFVDGAWVVDKLAVPGAASIAMAPDQQTLYLGAGYSYLHEVDPDTLKIKKTNVLGIEPNPSEVMYPRLQVAMTRDMRLWYGDGSGHITWYFDLLSSKRIQFTQSGYSPSEPTYIASGDGSRLIAAQQSPQYFYRVDTQRFEQKPLLENFYQIASLSEDGSRMLLWNIDLRDGNSGDLIGSLPPTYRNYGAVLSPDGRRVYALAASPAGSEDGDRSIVEGLDVFDATRVEPGTSQLVKLGRIPLSTQAWVCEPGNYTSCSTRVHIVISPLGDTLFWVGSQRVVAIPVPEALLGVKSAGRLRPGLQY